MLFISLKTSDRRPKPGSCTVTWYDLGVFVLWFGLTASQLRLTTDSIMRITLMKVMNLCYMDF